MPRLHVNIDHVATLRQARLSSEPDPVLVAGMAELAGANGITVHLREDRRHIQDRDVHILRQTVKSLLNLEIAATPEMVVIALEIKPDQVCIVPEKRVELTTEGGLDVEAAENILADAIPKLQKAGVEISLFVDPRPEPIETSARLGADFVELHTGAYANSKGAAQAEELHEAMCAAPGSATWAQLNREFHMCIYEAADHPRLVSLVRSLQDASVMAVSAELKRLPGVRERANSEHAMLLDAIRRRDLDAAVKVILHHATLSPN
ncbi:MAG TPA: pyridoxine 5'-phosphate synthase [Candidatus Handelsmanbacteria bacterium]|nr:pyridoxine 5'-phosphate synthase [Candidatus Handelsmanbacteria bacterium]